MKIINRVMLWPNHSQRVALKERKNSSPWRSLTLRGLSDENKIGDLFIVDIEFDQKNANEKQLFLTNFTRQFLKRKEVLSTNERSAFQLLDTMRLNHKGTINSCKTTAKPHATMDKKIAIALYAEHLHFLISRCKWRVTEIRGQYTFEQSKFKHNTA